MKVKSLITNEWQEGYEACQLGETSHGCPYADDTAEAIEWLSGWGACDFDDRAAEQFNLLDNWGNDYGQAA